MIHEHEALELASAAIDFGLSPELERELTLSLRECPVCAERAASYREQILLMRRLPDLDASDFDAAARHGGSDVRSDGNALTNGARARGGSAGRAAPRSRGRRGCPARSTQRAVGDPHDAAARRCERPDRLEPVAIFLASRRRRGREQRPHLPGRLAVDSIAEVVSAQPPGPIRASRRDSSIMYEPLLPVGVRLFVDEGPVVADGYDWYRVAPIGTDLPTGWVARGDHDATPWIAPANGNCPSVPVEIASLTPMHPLERLACFGNEPLAFRAVIEGGAGDGWIAGAHLNGDGEAGDSGYVLEVVPASDLEPGDLPDGRAAALVGALDDPRCADLVDGVLDCRTRFRVTDVSLDAVALNAGDLAMTTTDDLRVRDRPVVEDAGKRELLPGARNWRSSAGRLSLPAIRGTGSWCQPSGRPTAGGASAGLPPRARTAKCGSARRSSTVRRRRT